MEVEYNPIGEAPMGAETALIQAAHLLDIAGAVAVESKDTGALVEITQSWLLLADRLNHAGEEHDEQQQLFGFATDGVLESDVSG